MPVKCNLHLTYMLKTADRGPICMTAKYICSPVKTTHHSYNTNYMLIFASLKNSVYSRTHDCGIHNFFPGVRQSPIKVECCTFTGLSIPCFKIRKVDSHHQISS